MFDFILQIDRSVMEWIQNSLTAEWLDSLMIFITRLGDAGFIWLVAGIVLLCFKKTRIWGFMMIVAVAANFVIGDLLIKPLVGRVRPFVDDPAIKLLIFPPHGFSFPSGHSGSSFAAAVTLFCFNKKFGAGALVLAALIAFSRVYLYVHYPSDVLIGSLLGVVVGLLVIFIYRQLKQKMSHKSNES